MPDARTPSEQAGELLDPIMDLFGGADGGGAFAILRHQFLPQMIEANVGPQKIHEFVVMVTQFSKMCKMINDGKLG